MSWCPFLSIGDWRREGLRCNKTADEQEGYPEQQQLGDLQQLNSSLVLHSHLFSWGQSLSLHPWRWARGMWSLLS